ncbi:DoxX family membrane protein [Streptosporangium sp. NPDC023963]|uniref:DoxX family protein n=1 Tax=Streptosporangium sp. NPDC023963 TaxID=3155608 RepID=UPI0034155E61
MRQTLHDLASLAARLGVGGIFFANGWHKLEAGLNATAGQFESLGASKPYNSVWAATTMLTELIGGALLVAGLAVAACGLLLFAEALAVFILASGEVGLPLTGGDAKLIVALGAASILLAVGGAGRLSVDHMVVIKRREAEAAEDFAAEAEADDVIAALREPEAPPAPARPAAGKKPGESTPPASQRPAQGPASERPASEGPTSEGATDTAEFPAATRPRTRTRKPPSGAAASVPPATPAPTPVPAPAPGKAGDTLVAGKKDEPSGS